MTISNPHSGVTVSRFPTTTVAGRAGASFKPQHLDAILADPDPAGFFEIHAENYMGPGGPPHAALTRIREQHPVSLHGVCMSIGGLQPLDNEHLGRFSELVNRYEPALVSEHLAWSTHETTFFNDLLPLPYTDETLARVCEHIDQVQEAIRQPILLENPSTYLLFKEFDLGRNRLHSRDRGPDRLRVAAGREQRVCLRDQPRLFSVGVSGELSA